VNADEPERFPCRIELDGLTAYRCLRCLWEHIVEDDDGRAGPAAFEAHHCEDFPPPPISLLERHRFDEAKKLTEAIFARWDTKWAALPERMKQEIDAALAKRPLGRHQD